MQRNTRFRIPQHSRERLTLGGLSALYIAHAKAALAVNTIAVYSQSIRAFVEHVRPETPSRDVTSLHVVRFIEARIEAGRSEATVESDVKRIRAMFTWALEQGYVVRNPCAGAATPTVPRSPGRTMTEATFARMLIFAQHSAYPYRDGAILHVLWSCGLRINEVANLTMSDLDMKARTLHVAAKTAKTRESRVVPFTRECHAVLKDYLAVEHKHESPMLFPTRSGHRFTQAGISRLVREMGLRAGLRASAHDFRRAFVARLQAEGMSDSMIMELTGHRSIDMVRLYGRAQASENAIKIFRRLIG